MIQLFNVSKEYSEGSVALDNINLHIHKGEFVFIVGPSGAGKSTLIKLLTREVLPTGGQIFINGKSIVRLRPAKVPYLRRMMGIVFQDFRLLENKTAYENISFALEVVEVPRREIPARVNSALEMVGLAHKAQSFPNELSGGEQQRVAIARAIINNPYLLIADEPTGNLDPDNSWEIMKLLSEINKRGTTVIIATHDKEIVDKAQRRVLVLDKGRIVKDEQQGGYCHGDQ